MKAIDHLIGAAALMAIVACGNDSGPGPGLRFSSVSVGNMHACGVTPADTVYCWGDNADGELGDGTTTSTSVPVPIVGGLTFTSVSVGGGSFAGEHTCALTEAGVAYCWGKNAAGQLGNGTNVNSPVPVPVSGDLTFSVVSAGGFHTCGLTTSGAAYCWGYNNYGQLGDSSVRDTTLPVPVFGRHVFSTLSAGDNRTCALTPEGLAYCWPWLDDTGVPRLVDSTVRFTSVSAGQLSACAVALNHAPYCWGDDRYGELGNGKTFSNSVVVPGPVSGSLNLSALSSGALHTCGVTTEGVGYCWGLNGSGQLGNGQITEIAPIDSTVPERIKGSLRFITIDGGVESTCGVTVGQIAYCWGQNSHGQLGNGTNQLSTVPVRVSP